MVRGKFYFHNGRLKASSGLTVQKNPEQQSIYEVIRLIDGIPLFVEDHLERLEVSAAMIFGEKQFDRREIVQNILALSEENTIREGNIKVIVSRQAMPGNKMQRLVFFIPHYYPTPETYRQGYNLKSLLLERPVPNAKVVNNYLTEATAKLKAADPSIDEILLIRHDGIITEGSKSNIFFVSGKKLITPAKNLVLEGITRKKIIALCAANNIECVESAEINLNSLPTLDGAFITGTSPKVMPVKNIDGVDFNIGNPLIRAISGWYDEMIAHYVKSFSRH